MEFIQAHHLSMAYADSVLFSDATFEVGRGDKIGLIGNNGSGKTTLFKMIIGTEHPTGGDVFISKNAKLGYMEQHICSTSTHTLYDEMLLGFSHLIDMEKELEEIVVAIDNGNHSKEIIEKQASLNDEYILKGGLTYRSKARSTLMGFGFTEDDFELSCQKLSGGELSKVSLAKLLLSDANFLLLDEPTNHLDIPSVQWLEDFLASFDGSVLVISHDRYFLDKITNHTLLIEHKKFYFGKGGYTDFIESMAVEREIQQRHYSNIMDEAKRLEGIIKQQRQWNKEHTVRVAESREKQLEKLLATAEKPDNAERTVHFTFQPKRESGKDVLTAENLGKNFEGEPLFEDVSFYMQKGDRTFLLGKNGSGKTTIFRMILDEIAKTNGAVTLGANVEIGYFEQALASLDLSKTILDEVWDDFLNYSATEVRSALAAFLFFSEDIGKRIDVLSGGERARVSILKLMLSGANFLILDEPTNHLDISAREILEDALLGYNGTLLIISHDRYFINKLAKKVLWLEPNGVIEYSGNYDNFLEKRVAVMVKSEIKEKKEKPKVNLYELRKKHVGEVRRYKGQVSRTEKRIDEIDRETSDIHAKLVNPEISVDYEKVAKLTTKLSELEQELAVTLKKWEKAGSKLLELEEQEI